MSEFENKTVIKGKVQENEHRRHPLSKFPESANHPPFFRILTKNIFGRELSGGA